VLYPSADRFFVTFMGTGAWLQVGAGRGLNHFRLWGPTPFGPLPSPETRPFPLAAAARGVGVAMPQRCFRISTTPNSPPQFGQTCSFLGRPVPAPNTFRLAARRRAHSLVSTLSGMLPGSMSSVHLRRAFPRACRGLGLVIFLSQ
jgi:hypothetical protein